MTADERAGPDTITDFMAEDHRRLDAFFQSFAGDLLSTGPGRYDEFRAELLRHIGMEEKILIPAVQQANGGRPLSVAARLRTDHGALAALLMLPPKPAIIAMIQAILNEHNELEERQGGAYALCDELLAGDTSILTRLRASPLPAVAPPSDHPNVYHAARRVIMRAGYTWKDE